MTWSQGVYVILRCWRELLFGMCMMVCIPVAIFWWLSSWAGIWYLLTVLFGWGVWNFCMVGMVVELVLFTRVGQVMAELGMEDE